MAPQLLVAGNAFPRLPSHAGASPSPARATKEVQTPGKPSAGGGGVSGQPGLWLQGRPV